MHTKLSRAFERWRHILVAKIEARAQLQTGDVLLLEAKRVDDQRKSHFLSTHLLSLQVMKSTLRHGCQLIRFLGIRALMNMCR